MKHVLKTGALLVSLAALTPVAQAEFAGSVAFTTDYVWRGITQTAEDPAVQGGVTYTHDSGFYAGVWGSNVDFGAGVDANLEVDLNAGFAGEFSNGVGWDVGFIRYNYPGTATGVDIDFNEIYGALKYGMFSGKYSYSPDFGNAGDSAWYLEGAVAIELPEGFGLGLHAGHSGGEYWSKTGVGTKSYTDYKLGLTKEIAGFGFELAYTNTDLDLINKGIGADDDRVFLTVTKSF